MNKAKELEPFNQDVYTSCSENNMPHVTQMADLTEQEQNIVENLFTVAL